MDWALCILVKEYADATYTARRVLMHLAGSSGSELKVLNVKPRQLCTALGLNERTCYCASQRLVKQFPIEKQHLMHGRLLPLDVQN